MADDEPAAKRAKNESEEEPEESEEASDDEDDEEIIIDGEKFNVDDLEEESDDDEEESDDDDDDGSDAEDEDADLSDVLGGNVYVVTHHQESRGTKESLNNPDVIRKMDCEIVGVAGSLEKAEDVAREYAEGQFEVEVNEDFHGWFADGFEVRDEDSNDIVHKVMIEVHEMKD